MAVHKGAVFSFNGLPGLKAALDKASEEIRARVGDLMEETAKDIQETARQNVRASTNGDGDLEDAITVVGLGLNWSVGLSDDFLPRRGGDRVHQRPFLYGYILEYGKAHTPQEAFMRPAADTHFARFKARLPQIGLVI